MILTDTKPDVLFDDFSDLPPLYDIEISELAKENVDMGSAAVGDVVASPLFERSEVKQIYPLPDELLGDIAGGMGGLVNDEKDKIELIVAPMDTKYVSWFEGVDITFPVYGRDLKVSDDGREELSPPSYRDRRVKLVNVTKSIVGTVVDPVRFHDHKGQVLGKKFNNHEDPRLF